MMAPEA